MRRRVLLSSVLCFFLLLSSAFGLEVTDDTGRTVTLSCPASRVVSLTPANTEIVFALGAEGSLVGVTTYCDYPEEAKKRRKSEALPKLILRPSFALSRTLCLLVP